MSRPGWGSCHVNEQCCSRTDHSRAQLCVSRPFSLSLLRIASQTSWYCWTEPVNQTQHMASLRLSLTSLWCHILLLVIQTNAVMQTSKHHFQRLVVCVLIYDVDCVWPTLIRTVMTNWIVLTRRCADAARDRANRAVFAVKSSMTLWKQTHKGSRGLS